MATPHRALPVPAGADVPDVPLWLNALAVALDFDLFVIEILPRPAAGTLGRVHHDPGTGVWSIDTGAAWVTIATGGPFLPTAGGVLTGFLDLAGQELRGAMLVENRQKVTTVAAAGANRNLDAGASPLYDVTLDQNVTFTFAGVDGDRLFLLLRQPAAVKTVAWPATVDWPGAVAPAQVASTAVFYMFTRVAGRWTGYAQSVASTSKSRAVVKNTDETVVSSTAFQDDDELVLPVEANSDYTIFAMLRFVIGQATSAPAPKVGVNMPAGATLLLGSISELSSQTSPLMWGTSSASPAWVTAVDTTAVQAQSSLTDLLVILIGSVRVGANAGNLTVRWAQNTSSTWTTVCKAGSTLNLVKEG